MSLKYEPSSEPLFISAKQWFLNCPNACLRPGSDGGERERAREGERERKRKREGERGEERKREGEREKEREGESERGRDLSTPRREMTLSNSSYLSTGSELKVGI
jgi:hypothetical protein